MMKRIALFTIALFPLAAFAVGGGAHGAFWEQPKVSVDNKASLQRGAQLFANYCMGCHTAQYHRWSHVADDLDIPENVVQDNLIWTTDDQGAKHQVGTLMTNAMTDEYGGQIFGKAPPDLTLTAREKGPAWIYNYLRSFYLDESSPTGVNNAVLDGASMPHVMWPLQGWQRPVHASETDGGEGHGTSGDGDGSDPIVGFERVVEGSMTPEQFDRATNDLVNFMVYLGEPARLERTAIGGWVLFFLVILLGLAILLKKEYWKDIH